MLTLLSLLLPVADAGVAERIAAVVDEEIVAMSEVYDLGADFIGQRCAGAAPQCTVDAELEVLDALIERALIRGELKRLQLQVTGAEIDQAIDSVVREYQLADRDALKAEVERSGMTWDTYREQLREQLQVQRFQQRVLAPRVSVSEDEIRDLYQRTARKEKQLEVRLDAIGRPVPPDTGEEALAALVAEATAIADKLRDGSLSWDEAVAKHDTAHIAGAMGGRPYRKGGLAPELEATVFQMEAGQVSQPVLVNNLLFIVRLESKGMGEGDVRPFEEVRMALENQLFGEKIQTVQEEWYQRARREASVEILIGNP